mgnify:FL=1
MRTNKVTILIVLIWLITIALYAQQPHLEVTIKDSLTIPHTYDYVFQLPNGDLQFYKLHYGTSTLQISSFQYNIQINQTTPLVDIGTVSGLEGITNYGMYWKWRFNRLYLVHELTSGIAVIMLNQGLLTSRVISDVSVDQDFNLRTMTDIVAVDAIVIAATDSLVYYNIIDGNSVTLLQGNAYYCVIDQYPVVLSLPDTHFLYAKDGVFGVLEEVWFIYDSAGNIITTQVSTDESLLNSYFEKGSGFEPKSIFGKWYVRYPGLPMSNGCLECSFPEPDSLHYYFFEPPSAIEEWLEDISQFGDNGILRLYFDDLTELLFFYYNRSPLEQYPDVIYSFCIGPYTPTITPVSEDITTISTSLPSSIAISALWTYDFPVVHQFYFPVSTNVSYSCKAFSYNKTQFIIKDNKIYSFDVSVSCSNDEDLAVINNCEIQIFPNPIISDQQLTIRSNSKNNNVLDIYNLKGQKVKTLYMKDIREIVWDCTDDQGNKLAAGLYIINQRNRGTKPLKFMLIK